MKYIDTKDNELYRNNDRLELTTTPNKTKVFNSLIDHYVNVVCFVKR